MKRTGLGALLVAGKRNLPLFAFLCAGLMFIYIAEGEAARTEVKSFPHFTFSTPQNDIWIEKQSNVPGPVVFTARRGQASYQILLLENSLVGEKMRNASAKEVADDYRNGEKNNMIERGVRSGLYELSDVTMDEQTIGGKRYYTMTYSTKSQRHFEYARLYLYFPFASGNEYFLIAHYSESAPDSKRPTYSFASDFLDVLRSVAHTPAHTDEQVGKVDRHESEETRQQIDVGEQPESFTALIDLYRTVYELTQSPPSDPVLFKSCEKKLERGYITFVGSNRDKAFIVALTPKRLASPAQDIWLEPRFVLIRGLPHPRGHDPNRKSATMDWAYVLDRNGDGKVDYLAYLESPMPVRPEKHEGELPALQGTITTKALKIALLNTRMVFWHMADQNFDGRPDGVIVPLMDENTGWIDSALFATDTDFDGRYEQCSYYQHLLVGAPQTCERKDTTYYVPRKQLKGIHGLPPPDFLEVINEGAAKCRLSGSALYQRADDVRVAWGAGDRENRSAPDDSEECRPPTYQDIRDGYKCAR